MGGSYSNGLFPPTLSEKEEEYYVNLMKDDVNARNKLIEHNLRLVAHIVKKFEAVQKNNYVTYMVHINSLPTFVSRQEAQEVFDDDSNQQEGLKELIDDWFNELPNVKILSERTELVGRYPAKRVEYTYAPTAQGITLKLYAVAWMIFYEDTLVTLVGTAMSDDKDEMQKYGILFDMITGSVRFFDQYTDNDYD